MDPSVGEAKVRVKAMTFLGLWPENASLMILGGEKMLAYVINDDLSWLVAATISPITRPSPDRSGIAKEFCSCLATEGRSLGRDRVWQDTRQSGREMLP